MKARISAIVAVGIIVCSTGSSVTPLATASEPWYQRTLAAFVDAGYLTDATFIPGGTALRSEFVELTLKLLGGKVHVPFGDPVFDDVGLASPSFAVFQEGARGGWIMGHGSCIGTHPCLAAPRAPVNRAEASALIMRAFALAPGSASPAFTDNLPGQWYTDLIDRAASRCILQGDIDPEAPEEPRTVRPGDPMNGVEMLAMLQRAMQTLTYPDCSAASTPLPPAPRDFILIQSPLTLGQTSSASTSTGISASASAGASPPPPSESAPTIRYITVPSPAPPGNVSGAASSPLFFFDFPLLSGASSAGSAAGVTQDPGYPDLLARFQQYITQFLDLIGRARAVDSAAALRLLTALRTQIDLLNQFYPYVVSAKSRPLTGAEWAAVEFLETSLKNGFTAAPR